MYVCYREFTEIRSRSSPFQGKPRNQKGQFKSYLAGFALLFRTESSKSSTGNRVLPKSAKLVSRFRRDRSGNIAVIFALSLLPVLSGIGCAVDYSRATQLRSKLQSAVDAASVHRGCA